MVGVVGLRICPKCGNRFFPDKKEEYDPLLTEYSLASFVDYYAPCFVKHAMSRYDEHKRVERMWRT